MQAALPGKTDTSAAAVSGLPPPARWGDAWARAARRPGTRAALGWLGAVLVVAVIAPVVASDRPLIYRELGTGGVVTRVSLPLLERFTAVDLVLLAAGVLVPVVVAAPGRTRRSDRLGLLLAAGWQAAVTLVIVGATRAVASPESWLPAAGPTGARVAYGTLVGAGVGIVFMAVPSTRRLATRVVVVAFTAMIAGGASGYAWTAPLREPRWAEEIAAGRARGSFTLVPHSPNRGATERGFLAPGASGADAAVRAVLQLLEHRAVADQPPTRVAMTPVLLEEIESAVVSSGPGDAVAEAIVRDLRVRSAAGRLADGRAAIAAIEFHGGPRHLLGTDGFGCDVLSQFLHACRLSISIGLVSTGIAVFIGVTIGAIMGYFGGVIDLVLSRVVETFMAVPLLFLLIVAAGVLPPDLRGPYAMMAIIGCFSWTGAARFTRAEFLKLRGQDFVQSARALGLPLRSILFRHMLPNGLTPVLVDASFAIAAAITIEATLSFLGLGPVDQPSWGRLLAGAYDHSGVFRWWLAAVPGGAVFLTVLSYNLIGESFRDALDPRAPGNLPR